jgi:hypothetical protein
MRDRLDSFPFIHIFCQNVNRNYALMDTLLSSLYENYYESLRSKTRSLSFQNLVTFFID